MRSLRSSRSARRRLVVTLFGIALVATACRQDVVDPDPEEIPADAIVIGIVDGFSGLGADFADDKLTGARLLVDEVNAAGGVLGRPVQLLVRDDELSPELGVAHVAELYEERGADLVMGAISSDVLLAINDWVRDNDRHFLAWDARTVAATSEHGHEGLVRTVSNTYMDGRAMAVFFADQPYERWGIVSPGYEYGRSAARHFQEHLTELKPEVTFVETQFPTLGEENFDPYLTAIAQEEIDALYVAVWGGDALMFIRQADAVGLFEDVEVVFLHGGGSLMDPAGIEMPEGMWVGTNYHWQIDNPENEAFVQAFRDARGRLPRDYNATGYVGMQFMLEAIERAGTTDGDAVFAELRGMRLDTPIGPITIRELDGQADMGLHIGRTVEDPANPQPFGLQAERYIAGEEVMQPEDEVRAARQR